MPLDLDKTEEIEKLSNYAVDISFKYGFFNEEKYRDSATKRAIMMATEKASDIAKAMARVGDYDSIEVDCLSVDCKSGTESVVLENTDSFRFYENIKAVFYIEFKQKCQLSKEIASTV